MSAFLKLPDPPLPPALSALRTSALRQEPDSGFSTNMRPLRTRRTAHDYLPNPYLVPSPTQPFPPTNPTSSSVLNPGPSATPDGHRHNTPNRNSTPSINPTPAINQTMIQGFEWYVPADGAHWRRLEQVLPSLAHLGATSLWIPPACRAASPSGNGYDVHDLWDLGEFPLPPPAAAGWSAGEEEEKGDRVRTKWGTKEELVRMAEVADRVGVRVLFDAVLNHKAGADYCEKGVLARKMEDKDRLVAVEGSEREIDVWTGFGFPRRKGVYSGMEWKKEHFTGVDYDDREKDPGVWKFEGKEWADDVDEELGNYDFLMFANIDHKHPEVREDLFRWIEWLPRQMKLGGLRLDAIKHYSFRFLRDFVHHAKSVAPDLLLVGEYWREDSEYLAKFVEFMDHRISLFDVQLVSNFSKLSSQVNGDLRTVLDDSLAIWKPDHAVTFVVNHDTQAGQSLELPVAPFFIPLAYALILLRANCGIPCVFYADLFGSMGQHPQPGFANFIPPTSGGAALPKMMLARKLWAYGSQYDYFDERHCVGFTRIGHPAHSGGHGLAVVMTNAWEHASKRMFVGEHHAGEVWTDLLRWCPGQVVIGTDGWGVFPVGHRSVAVWVNSQVDGRGEVDSFVFDFDIYNQNSPPTEES
ncbi:alpha-amylase [Dichotomopilus funicola]|uniref:Alpha-amylase n=1 Tax=Dichotomopilus funicola TaxID=1934379 RepID=A0AAN6V5G5_9PEZI|nr:alpha-amylase [Dichotomopilus funicola]